MGDEKNIIAFTAEVDPNELGNPKAIANEVRALIKQGMTPEEACKSLGIDLKRNADLRKQMRLLVAEVGEIPAQVQKELVRMARVKIMLKNVHEDDHNAQKLALQAAKQIAGDPDVGLNVPPQVINLIDLGSLEDVFKHLPDTDIVEAEFEEVPDEDKTE